MRAYLSCTSAWPVEQRYLEPGAYQPRWDRFVKEPGDWWERNVDAITARFLHVAWYVGT